jgi:hypothetical protein
VLMPIIMGPARQLVDVTTSAGAVNSSALAGTYDGNAETYDYPSILDYADPLTTSVSVYFRYGAASSLTEIDDDEWVATSSGVTISGGAQSISAGGTTKVDVYIQYQALRLDLAPYGPSNLNGTKTGTQIESTTDITTYLGDIDIRNPLALGTYIAIQNAPNSSVMALGIDDVTTAAPEGTTAAYTRALEFAETLEVYAMVPLTQRLAVLSLFPAHVNSMSASTAKRERIAIMNVQSPETGANETQASGSYGRITAANTFNTSGDLDDVTANDILVVQGDATTYTVSSISGTSVTVTPASLDTSVTTDRTWSIYTPGETLSTRGAIATAYAAIGTSYNNRRVFITVPDIVEISVGGILQELPGYYGCAAAAGQTGEVAPQQPLTNFPIAGISGLDGSNDYFTPSQLNTIASGGMYIIVQEGTGTVPYCRHQLSTAVGTIETRELSITKAIDYYAKSLRLALAPTIGRNVITDRFISMRVSPIITGVSDYLKEGGAINGYTLTSIQQSSTAPDTIVAVIDVTPAYPCNTIRITLEV